MTGCDWEYYQLNFWQKGKEKACAGAEEEQ